MGESAYVVTRGIVLRETVTGDADKILTLLTEDRGKTAVIARGVRKKNCKYAACSQSLVYSEWTLYHRGDWYYANEGATLEQFRELRESLEAMALGAYFAELAEAAAVEEIPAAPLLRHLLNGLYALSALHKPPELVKPVFELKLLSLAGYEPLLDACAVCGNPAPVQPCLDAAQGVLLCHNCGGRHRGLLPLCGDSLAAARRTLYGDQRRLYAFRMGDAALGRLSAAVETFLTVQFDRTFQTLDFYKSLSAPV